MAVSVAFFACSDSEPTDEEFVLDLCGATTALRTDLAAALEKSRSEPDSQRAAEALVPPLKAFVDAFEDADPPKDLEGWHSSATEQLKAAVARFETEKTLSSLEGFGDSPVPDPPAEAKARLRAVGADLDECEGVAFLKP